MSYLLNYNPGAPQYTYPRRGGAGLSGTAIIHTAECGMDLDGPDDSAENCAAFIATRSDYGSYHRLVDSDSIIDMLPWEYEAWQDSETNNWAVGISAAVQAGKWHTITAVRRDRIYRNMAACAADFVRYMAGKGITVPLRRITGAEARNSLPGFCAHGDSGVHRSDPGVQFDWALFFDYTAQALGGITTQGTTQEDDMPYSEADLRRIIVDALADTIQPMHDTTREHLKAEIPKRVWAQPIDWRNPATGELVAGATTPEMVLSYVDANTARITDARSVAASIPDGIAQAVIDALVERLGK